MADSAGAKPGKDKEHKLLIARGWNAGKLCGTKLDGLHFTEPYVTYIAEI